MADINSPIEIGVTTGPIRGSRKVHVVAPGNPKVKVAMREIDLEPSSGEPPLRVYDSTIANNAAAHAGSGGLAIGAGTTLISTIVAGNTANGAPSDIGLRNGASPATTTISGNHNLILASTIALPDDTIAQPPLLGPLADNGGPTLTHALLDGSPAIDHGSNPDSFSHDQRGYARVVGASADIGAFEFAPLPDNIFFDDFECWVDACPLSE